MPSWREILNYSPNESTDSTDKIGALDDSVSIVSEILAIRKHIFPRLKPAFLIRLIIHRNPLIAITYSPQMIRNLRPLLRMHRKRRAHLLFRPPRLHRQRKRANCRNA
jgi:hypothetical protein